MYPYFIVFFLLLILPKKNINKSAFILLLIFLSIRYDIGFDFPEYYKVGKEYEMLGTSLFVNLKDYVRGEGYLYYKIEILNRVLYQITWFLKNPQVIIFLYSFLELYFIKKGLDRQKINSRYVWILFFSFPIFMFSYMSIMRQSVAMSIIFYNYNNFIEKKHIKSLIFIFIACLFHNTAIIAIFIYLIVLLNINLKYILGITGIFSISIVILQEYFSYMYFLKKYAFYFNNHIQSGGGKVFYLMLFISIFLLILYKKLINLNKSHEKLLQIILIGTIFYLNIFLIGDLASRLAVYFIFYILYILEDIFQIFRNKNIGKIIFIFSCFILLNISLYIDIKSTNVLVPYKTYFQEVKNL